MAKASDNVFPKLLLSEGAAPSTPAAGVHGLFVDTSDDKLKRIDPAGTITQVEGGSGGGTFSSYTPVLTGSTTNPILGTGSTAAGRYTQNGKHVAGRSALKFGTSGISVGSGNYFVSLPVAASTTLANEIVGVAQLYDDSGVVARVVSLFRVTATTVQMLLDGGATVQNNAPWTWAANDMILLNFNYEAA